MGSIGIFESWLVGKNTSEDILCIMSQHACGILGLRVSKENTSLVEFSGVICIYIHIFEAESIESSTSRSPLTQIQMPPREAQCYSQHT